MPGCYARASKRRCNHVPAHADHGPHLHGAGKAGRGLATAFFLNLGFTVIEFAGGFWTNSVAVISDAVHDAGDCLSLASAWYLEHLSHSKPNRIRLRE